MKSASSKRIEVDLVGCAMNRLQQQHKIIDNDDVPDSIRESVLMVDFYNRNSESSNNLQGH
jgi:hypothetical protein